MFLSIYKYRNQDEESVKHSASKIVFKLNLLLEKQKQQSEVIVIPRNISTAAHTSMKYES